MLQKLAIRPQEQDDDDKPNPRIDVKALENLLEAFTTPKSAP